MKLAEQQIIRKANLQCNKLCRCQRSHAIGALFLLGEAEGTGRFQPGEGRRLRGT